MDRKGITLEEYISQAKRGALLNPRVDSTFKALFTQNTRESKEALKSFLEAATEKTIAEVKIQSSDSPIGYGGQRGVTFDILCTFDNGLSADIEMQAFNQKYDYGKRAEYQVARLETTYLDKGASWEAAPKVYQITVLDFNYNPKEDKEPISRYAMRTGDGKELSNTLNVIFIELPKVQELEGSIETNSRIENWAIFLKEADNPNKKEVIERLTQKEAGLMYAQNALSSISADRDLWIAQYREELRERDAISGLEAARNEGISIGEKRGRAEGRAEGKAEGKAEGIMETAQKMASLRLPLEVIAEATGLPLERIKSLK